MRTVHLVLLAILLNVYFVPAQEKSIPKKDIYHNGWADLTRMAAWTSMKIQKRTLTNALTTCLVK